MVRSSRIAPIHSSSGLNHDISLTKGRYGLGASWDTTSGRSVDIDLQCVVVNSSGTITDCAYYNNLKAARGVTHSGDEALGKPGNVEEMVWVNFARLPSDVRLLVFVVAAYSGGKLRDVSNGRLHVFEERECCEVATIEMESSDASVDVVAAMFREGNTGAWKFRTLDLPALQGQHFMDILPTLSTVIRSFIPSAPQRQKVAFAMEKGGILDLPKDMGLMVVGLGWDVDDGECDLDVSAVLLDKQGQDLETVFFGRLESQEHGVKHTGDNLTGEGDGDDEQILVSLDRVGPQVDQIVFVVNVYTPNLTFAKVANPFCRVVDQAGSSASELCRYSLREAGSEQGLIIARLAREPGGRWGFHALGLPCRGRTYKDSLPQIKAAATLKTSSLVVRQNSSSSQLDGPFGLSAASTPRAPRSPASSSCSDGVVLPSPWERQCSPTAKGGQCGCSLM
jgi:tellurium resistance protein TerZ